MSWDWDSDPERDEDILAHCRNPAEAIVLDWPLRATSRSDARPRRQSETIALQRWRGKERVNGSSRLVHGQRQHEPDASLLAIEHA
jgi:hypothetical protein